MRNKSSCMSTVIVPGVMVMEFASTTLPGSVRTWVWNEVISGSTTSFGDHTSLIVAHAERKTSFTRYRKYPMMRGRRRTIAHSFFGE